MTASQPALTQYECNYKGNLISSGAESGGSLSTENSLQKLEELFALSNTQTPMQSYKDHEEANKYDTTKEN